MAINYINLLPLGKLFKHKIGRYALKYNSSRWLAALKMFKYSFERVLAKIGVPHYDLFQFEVSFLEMSKVMNGDLRRIAPHILPGVNTLIYINRTRIRIRTKVRQKCCPLTPDQYRLLTDIFHLQLPYQSNSEKLLKLF